MNSITLKKTDWQEVESILGFINELLESLRNCHDHAKTSFLNSIKNSHKAVEQYAQDIKDCHDLRRNRKHLNNFINSVNKQFNSLAEKKQVEVELLFFNSLKELKECIPAIESEMRDNKVSFCYRSFVMRELNKMLNIFKGAQEKMSSHLYPDNSQKILSNPELYQKLVDTWADVDDY